MDINKVIHNSKELVCAADRKELMTDIEDMVCEITQDLKSKVGQDEIDKTILKNICVLLSDEL